MNVAQQQSFLAGRAALFEAAIPVCILSECDHSQDYVLLGDVHANAFVHLNQSQGSGKLEKPLRFLCPCARVMPLHRCAEFNSCPKELSWVSEELCLGCCWNRQLPAPMLLRSIWSVLLAARDECVRLCPVFLD